MLANFLGVLPILTPPLCALAFINIMSKLENTRLSKEAGTKCHVLCDSTYMKY
jgi:hypothetical protein